MLPKSVSVLAMSTAYYEYAESVLKYGIIFWGKTAFKERTFVLNLFYI